MRLRLQHLFWVGGLAVAVCCAALGGGALKSSIADVVNYEAGLGRLERFHAVLATVNDISLERGAANLLMTGPAEGAVAGRLALDARRAAVDRRIMAAEGHQPRASNDDPQVSFIELRERLAAARRTVDTVVALAAEQRSGAMVSAAIEAMFSASDSAQAARDRLGRDIIAKVPQVGSEIFLGMSTSGLRDRSGRLGSYVVMMLVSGAEKDAASFERLLATSGRLSEFRRELHTYGQLAFAGGRVRQAIEEVEDSFFGRGLPLAISTARRDLGDVRVSVEAFARDYAPTLRPAERLREAVAAAALDKMTSLRDAARLRLIVTAALTAAVCAILLVLALAFGNNLFNPLHAARQQMAALARGDLDEPHLDFRMSAEVREMFDGLDALRKLQLEKRAGETASRHVALHLKKLAETDMLTGLPNRRAVEALAADALEEAGRTDGTVGIVLFDVDHFKGVNDTYGHAVGDAVLRAIARAVEPGLRPFDCFARVGGEEFLMLMPDVDATEAARVAEQMRSAVANLAIEGVERLKVTGSFGVALWTPDLRPGWEALVALADQRLYAAKKAGRNRVVASGPLLVETSGDGVVAAA